MPCNYNYQDWLQRRNVVRESLLLCRGWGYGCGTQHIVRLFWYTGSFCWTIPPPLSFVSFCQRWLFEMGKAEMYIAKRGWYKTKIYQLNSFLKMMKSFCFKGKLRIIKKNFAFSPKATKPTLYSILGLVPCFFIVSIQDKYILMDIQISTIIWTIDISHPLWFFLCGWLVQILWCNHGSLLEDSATW